MGEDDNIEWHFDGTIENFVMLDRPLEEIELLFLSENNGNVDALGALYGNPVEIEDEEEEDEDTTEGDTSDDTTSDETEDDTSEDEEQEEETDEEEEEEDTSNEDDQEEETEDDDDADEETEETSDEEEEEEEEDSFGAIFTKILNALLSIFGFGGDDDDNDTANTPTDEEIETTLTEVEDLLSDLFTDPVDDSETMQVQVEEEDEVMMV